MNFLIKDTSLLEGLGKMELLKYKCIFDYWNEKNLKILKEDGQNSRVHKEDFPFLTAKLREQNEAKKRIKK